MKEFSPNQSNMNYESEGGYFNAIIIPPFFLLHALRVLYGKLLFLIFSLPTVYSLISHSLS